MFLVDSQEKVYLLKVTGKREKEKPVTVNREIIGELPPDPNYWDAAANFLLKRMEADGWLPQPDHKSLKRTVAI